MTSTAFKRTLKWQPGDIFVVPLADGSFGYVQAIAPVMAHAIDFAVLSSRSTVPMELSQDNDANSAIGVLATWRKAITGGRWGKVGRTAPHLSRLQCPNQVLIEKDNGLGVNHGDVGLVESFLSAYHGLIPWNLYAAHCFDEYLVPGRKKPDTAYELSAADLAVYRRAVNARHGA
jgi:Immunity protein 26